MAQEEFDVLGTMEAPLLTTTTAALAQFPPLEGLTALDWDARPMSRGRKVRGDAALAVHVGAGAPPEATRRGGGKPAFALVSMAVPEKPPGVRGYEDGNTRVTRGF